MLLEIVPESERKEGIALLEDNLRRITQQLEQESAPFGRVPKLIAVTKYISAEETLALAPLGITDIGENRVQVIRDKLPVIGGKFDIHMIGRLQTNKVKYIIKDVRMIHSVDNLPLIEEIDRQAQKAEKRMDILLEVNIAGEVQKGGVEESAVIPLMRKAAQYPSVHVCGLMTMMPLGAERTFIFEKFTQMRRLLDICHEEAVDGTDMEELSMGMSQDYDLAARAGATMVRVGTALFR